MSPNKKAKKKATKKKAGAAGKPVKLAVVAGSRKARWVMPRAVTKALTEWDGNVVNPVWVLFNDKGGLNNPHASRKAKHGVWFCNLGKVSRRLTLSRWPFLPPAGDITVPAGKCVGPFLLNPADPFIGTIQCTATPGFDEHAPGDPQFSVGD